MEPEPSIATSSADRAPARRAILVLGMHRSGTSALAGVLAQLGCAMPARPMAADAGNERGYFESRRVYDLHNEMLAAAGTSWSDWTPLDPAWLASDGARTFRDRAATVIEAEFGAAALFVLKDPRLCGTASLWLGALDDLGMTPLVVLTHRHPAEVAASLGRRNGMDRDAALLLWLRYVLDAEAATRGLARVHTSYARLLADWRAVAGRVEAGLGLPLPRRPEEAGERVEAFLSSGLRHHEADPADVAPPSWVGEARAVLERWAERGEDAEGREALDAVRGAFDAAVPVFAPMAARWRSSDASSSAEAAAAAERGRADALASELAVRMRELADAARLVAQAREKGRAKHARVLARLRAAKGDLAAERERREAATDRTEVERRARLHAEAAREAADAERDALLASSSWRLTGPLRAAIDRARGSRR